MIGAMEVFICPPLKLRNLFPFPMEYSLTYPDALTGGHGRNSGSRATREAEKNKLDRMHKAKALADAQSRQRQPMNNAPTLVGTVRPNLVEDRGGRRIRGILAPGEHHLAEH